MQRNIEQTGSQNSDENSSYYLPAAIARARQAKEGNWQCSRKNTQLCKCPKPIAFGVNDNAIAHRNTLILWKDILKMPKTNAERIL